MTRRLVLPLASPAGAPSRPTVEVVRRRLGGRASTEAGAGELVSLSTVSPTHPQAAPYPRLLRSLRGSRGETTGVVLFVRGEELDVWLEHDLVQRVRRADTRPAGEVATGELSAVARDARVFAALREGQRVAFRQDGGVGEGTLVEKCRFGALVEVADGAIIGVGFRRLAPHDGNDDHGSALS